MIEIVFYAISSDKVFAPSFWGNRLQSGLRQIKLLRVRRKS